MYSSRRPVVLAALPLATSLLFVAPLAAQQARATLTARPGDPAVVVVGERAVLSTATQSRAVRAERPPVLDGRMDDAVWAHAQKITGFRTFEPTPDGDPTQRTEAYAAYDDRNLYVFVRAFDTHPDSIVSLLSRRDVRTASDQIKIMVDSYHDRRSGYEFAVNPAGVQRDYFTFNDSEEDGSWDAIWHAATAIDSLGWTAEFAIPLSQLRYADAPEHTFGLMVVRDIARNGERSSWPILRRSDPGISSQLGELSGIVGIPVRRRLEVTPYTVAKSYDQQQPNEKWTRRSNVAAGADVKYGLTSNLTLDATINPDFGQVEADPATYNLGVSELFFQERRPFFLEGTGIFRFDLSCDDGSCSGLFYSRRIGQAPRLAGSYGDTDTPNFTTILGATKLTGRTSNGLSVGFLDAVTQRELGRNDITVEPASNYLVARAQQELRGGNTVIGAMATGVNRNLDDTTTRYIRSRAMTAGIDARHRFASKRYELTGYFAASQVGGSEEAIARTQAGPVHGFARVDANLDFDSTRTTLGGTAGQLYLAKIGGGLTRFSTGYTRTSPGFEINDAGYLSRADQQSYTNWVGLRWIKPRSIYRFAGLNFNQWQFFNTEGMRLNMGGNVNGHMQFKNLWFANAGLGTGQRSAYNDRDARGGPAFRRSPNLQGWMGFEGDSRRHVTPGFNAFALRGDGGRSHYYEMGPWVEVRASSRFSASFNPYFSRNIDDSQWYGNYLVRDGSSTDGRDHYTFAHLDQKSVSLTTRINFTATRNLSLQIYGQPYFTAGQFEDPMELSDDPRNKEYTVRFRPTTAAGSELAGFNYKAFNSNSVVRWEYRPGSVLYFVWSQGRELSDPNPEPFDFRRDRQKLFGAHPSNTFLIKGSYWFSL